MKQKELIKHLREREQELLRELEAIRTLVSVYSGDSVSISATKTEDDITGDYGIKPKDKSTWEEYALYILKAIGGKGRAADVVKAATKVNPKEKEETLKSALKSKLSKLQLRGTINATPGKLKKDGYTYEIKKEP
ncbi:MAG: hypothetical protein KDE33_07925 [Bacteroidetes bacterium]|nr:hypothetical protein [Bacteroidota bacterium]MCB0537442.1 hypothetical protein [Bacteroidota bacterium]